MYDKDSSGHLNAFELRQALTSAGYSVNNKILESLALRYGDSSGQIAFDDFIMCAIKLKAMIGEFKIFDKCLKLNDSLTTMMFKQKSSERGHLTRRRQHSHSRTGSRKLFTLKVLRSQNLMVVMTTALCWCF